MLHALRIYIRPLAVALAAGIALTLHGCGASESVERGAPPPRTDVVTSSPLETARTFLMLVREDVAAVAARDRPHDRAAIAQLAWHVVARDEIAAAHGLAGQADRKQGAGAILRTVEQWSAMLAYYLPAIRDEELAALPGSTPNRAQVRVTVLHAERQRVVKLALTQSGPHWLVRGVEISPPAVTTSPATQPATSPSVP